MHMSLHYNLQYSYCYMILQNKCKSFFHCACFTTIPYAMPYTTFFKNYRQFSNNKTEQDTQEADVVKIVINAISKKSIPE